MDINSGSHMWYLMPENYTELNDLNQNLTRSCPENVSAIKGMFGKFLRGFMVTSQKSLQ